jgi:phosphoenolpyruvate carboxykinase (GTP)
LARTNPKDVARVESKTVICSKKKIETIPEPAEGVTGQLGYWISPEELDTKIHTLFPGSMKGNQSLN